MMFLDTRVNPPVEYELSQWQLWWFGLYAQFCPAKLRTVDWRSGAYK